VCFDGVVDGPHDLGGRQGFGPVVREEDEPPFHHEWEGKVFALMGATSMAGLTQGFRHSIERMEPGHYLTSPYYEHWLTGLSTLLVEQGVVDPDDLEARAGGRVPLSLPATADLSQIDPEPVARRFAVNDRVRVRDIGFAGHTRCPSYVMRREGEVVRVDEPSNVPDVEHHLGVLVQEHTYGVRFAATDLWPESTDERAVVHVDLYERYLEPAG
jgi:nitrile hydratase